MYTPTHAEANEAAGLFADFKITTRDVLEALQFSCANEFDRWQHSLILRKLDEYEKKEASRKCKKEKK